MSVVYLNVEPTKSSRAIIYQSVASCAYCIAKTTALLYNHQPPWAPPPPCLISHCSCAYPIGPEVIIVTYCIVLHTLKHSLQLSSGAEYEVPSVTIPTPKVMDTAMYSEVFEPQKVHACTSSVGQWHYTISILC